MRLFPSLNGCPLIIEYSSCVACSSIVGYANSPKTVWDTLPKMPLNDSSFSLLKSSLASPFSIRLNFNL